MLEISVIREPVPDEDWFVFEYKPDSQIRVVTTPVGDPPERWRRGWIGATMDATRVEDSTGEITLMEGQPMLSRGPVYVVERDIALAALRERSPRAAEWYESNLRKEVTGLSFSAKEVIELASR